MTIGNLRLLLFGAALGWGLFPYWAGWGLPRGMACCC